MSIAYGRLHWELNQCFFRYDPVTGATTKYMEPSGMALGLHFDKNGDLLISQDADNIGGRAVLRRNITTDVTIVVADRYQGKRFNGANDLTTDAKGRIYFSDARYAGEEPFELPNAVYRIDTDGKVTQLATDLFRPNGIEVSPDGKRLYVAAANFRRLPINPLGPHEDRFGITAGGVAAYDLDDNGNISNGRLIFRNDELACDGMTMDRDGNLYITQHNGNPKEPKGVITVLDPSGKTIEQIAAPEGVLTTNVGFGRGKEVDVLYLSAALPWRLYRIKTVRRGHYF
ncbi:MAG: SMP-30/gluconolactonase/LRE family protein [Betaproteobacteria bacterium]|nr:SMP-30/gluconolactonase/LRE family protein [Betaproteobacteria bacterium]